MKPLIYSKKEAEYHKLGWHRVGEDIAYYQNNQNKAKFSNLPGSQANMSSATPNNFYTLSFRMNFKHDEDEVYLAYCYPYTFTDCQKHLEKICKSKNKDRVRRAPLCKSLAGNDCDMLIVTNFKSQAELIAERPAVILTSRVHPGESNASWVMEGLIDFLVGDEFAARDLRDKFVFKIVPMLNPDGVIVGNYRCSLSGFDLNRQY
jgi:murein tripeptide amidase MpaA